MKIKIPLISLILCLPSLVWAVPQALTFKKQEMTTHKRTVLCNLIPEECRDKPTWTLYKVAETSNQYYLISNLKLYQLEQNKQSYKDFKSVGFFKLYAQESQYQLDSG